MTKKIGHSSLGQKYLVTKFLRSLKNEMSGASMIVTIALLSFKLKRDVKSSLGGWDFIIGAV